MFNQINCSVRFEAQSRHTSGSTELPKAINVTNGLYSTFDNHQLLEADRTLNVQQ